MQKEIIHSMAAKFYIVAISILATLLPVAAKSQENRNFDVTGSEESLKGLAACAEMTAALITYKNMADSYLIKIGQPSSSDITEKDAIISNAFEAMFIVGSAHLTQDRQKTIKTDAINEVFSGVDFYNRTPEKDFSENDLKTTLR